MKVTLESWIEKTLKLLKIEYEADLEQNRIYLEKCSLKELENNGIAIRKLVVTNQRSVFNRQYFNFSVPPQKKDEVNLTNFSIKNGDIVGICDNKSGTNFKLSGVVLKVQRSNLEIAIENNADHSMLEQGESFNLVKQANDVTYRRLKAAVSDLFKCESKTYLISILFKNSSLMEPLTALPPYSIPLSLNNEDDIVWFNPNLNDCQKDAIRFALYQKHLAVIHGPPGTGKTTTLTEIILQLICRNEKVFVFAPSNVAVDNIFKQLLIAANKMSNRFKVKKDAFIRLGHAARIDSDIQKYSLDAIVSNLDSSVVADLKEERNQLTKESRVPRGKFKEIRKEIALYENKSYAEALKGADVIMSTLVSAHLGGQLRYLVENSSEFMFDNVIIDECAQALEAETWIPLAHTKKCILAGDHQQLSATIISQEAADQGLSISLMERVAQLFKSCEDKVFRMLSVQYRMNKLIMDWSSANFYDNKLVAFEGVADRQLDDFAGNSADPLPVIRLIDTAGCDMYELEDSLSKGNRQEADIVCLYVRSLLDDYGIPPSDIGVISPYRLQISLIESRCRREFPDCICNNLEVQSVDGFQGREKEVIILSLVRSNQLGEIGFLIEQRRLNVAITRARSHLVVIGDSETIRKGSPVLESFIDYCYENADIVNAADYLPELEKFDEIKIEFKTKNKSEDQQKYKKGSSNGDNRKANQGKDRKTGNNNKNFKNRNNSNTTPNTTGKLDQQKIKFILQDFIRKSTLPELKFEASLTAAERRMVHEECEKMGLIHESTGGDTNRRVVVKKKPKN